VSSAPPLEGFLADPDGIPTMLETLARMNQAAASSRSYSWLGPFHALVTGRDDGWSAEFLASYRKAQVVDEEEAENVGKPAPVDDDELDEFIDYMRAYGC
jgi:hypothetical protein